MRRPEVPTLPGILTARQVAATAASIARIQEPNGAIPWTAGQHVDAWNHVEAAMGLLVGGQIEAAERGYEWLSASQRPDGSWPAKTTAGVVTDDSTDTNTVAYVAVGMWHHWLVRRDERFVRRHWPVVRKALDFVVDLQLPFGGIAWATDGSGAVDEAALLTGSSSIFHALRAGLSLSELIGNPQPEWELAAGRLRHAIRAHGDLFEDKSTFSMDWYYPVLGGAVRGERGRALIATRWDDFVVPGLGVRCVDTNPWVTGAETCELVLALDALEERDAARQLLSDMQHLRADSAGYWTGYVFADEAFWPEEQTSWTAASVILAADALSGATRGADVFREQSLPADLPELAMDCSCSGGLRECRVS